jgi:hypothetical protein
MPITSVITGGNAGAAQTVQSYVKLNSTDNTTGYNGSGLSFVPFDTQIIEPVGNISHDVSTNNTRVTFDAAGIYVIGFSILLTSTVQRAAPDFMFRKNGNTRLPDRARHTYMRSRSGHNESTANLQTIIDASAGDYVEVAGTRDGSASGVVLAVANRQTFYAYNIT